MDTGGEELLTACREGDLCRVKHLVEERRVDPHSCRDHVYYDTPLHWASHYGHLDVVKYLIEERECDVDCRDTYADTPLLVAAVQGRLPVVQYLVRERKCDPMCRGQWGRTSLHHACARGRLDVVKYLMEECKVSGVCQDEASGATPLHLAAVYGTLDVVRYMIEHQKCDMQCGDICGNTVLHHAAQGDRLEIVQYLVEERGCDTTSKNRNGRTALHLACAMGRPEIYLVRYLLQQSKVDASCRDNDGFTPLHVAAELGALNIVKFLVEDVKVDPLCQDNRDITPLHMASLSGHLSVVKLLVEDCLCDPGVRDHHGQTPFNYAEDEGHTIITSYLSAIERVSTDIRRTLVVQLKPYTRKAQATDVVLGRGTYGSVIELTSAGGTLAGKVFKTSSNVQLQAISNKLCAEIILMSQLHHVNIVESRGVCFLPDQPLPLLLMERLVCSLHSYILDPYNSDLQLRTKVSLLVDVSSGLGYLHGHMPTIIHRDLTAKNVLLNRDFTAKISDFGNSRVMDLDPEASPETFTSLPGTLEYMPPEAQGGSTRYDPSLDVFSFGHLALFTITQTPVRPLLPPTFPEASGDGTLHARSEVKRRQQFIKKAEQLLPDSLSLVVLIKQCLHNHPALRPRTSEIPEKLKDLSTFAPDQIEVAGPATLADPDLHSGRELQPYQEAKDQQDLPSSTVTEERTAIVLCTAPRLAQLKLLRSPHGKKVEMIKRLAWKWKDIGVLLDFDAQGNTLSRISADEGRAGVESCCQAMLQLWLQGSGMQPVSWATLLQVLEDSECGALASEVRTVLSSL